MAPQRPRQGLRRALPARKPRRSPSSAASPRNRTRPRCASAATPPPPRPRTGSTAEGFHLEDGLQCEACHGPGSEYAPEEIMKDQTQAMTHGLKTAHEGGLPDLPSRQRFPRRRAQEETVRSRSRPGRPSPIPTPDNPNRAVRSSRPGTPPEPPAPHKYTGVMACAACHTGPEVQLPVQPLAPVQTRPGLCRAWPPPRGRRTRPRSRRHRRSAEGRSLPQVPRHRPRHRPPPAFLDGLRPRATASSAKPATARAAITRPKPSCSTRPRRRAKGLLGRRRQHLRALPRTGPRQDLRLRDGGEGDRPSHEATASGRRRRARPTRIR